MRHFRFAEVRVNVTHVIRHGKIQKAAHFVAGGRASVKNLGCYYVMSRGLLKVFLLGVKVLHALKLVGQAHIEQDDGGRKVLARDGGSSRQLGGIDGKGSVEERKAVVVLVGGIIEEGERMFQGNTSNRKESASHFVGKAHVFVLVDATKDFA
jgi:hypothetical protein